MPYATNIGVKIHYQIEGTGQPLIMLHGLLGNSKIYRINGFVDILKRDYKLISIDLRGFGKSDKPHDASEYSYRTIIDDVIAVLDAAEVDQVHLYGHSFGGWFTYGLAYYYPNRIKSLISDGVPGRGVAEGLPPLASYQEGIAAHKSFSEEVKKELLKNDLDAFAAISEWLTLEGLEIFDFIDSAIEQINLPTLLLVSNVSEASDEIRLLKKTAEYVKDAKYIQFKELKHLDLSNKSEIVVPHMLDFLASVPD
jgi:pimeloyl-ACP methyl ester carboxylesterase